MFVQAAKRAATRVPPIEQFELVELEAAAKLLQSEVRWQLVYVC